MTGMCAASKMSLTLQSCAQETADLYDAMEKAVGRSEVHCVSMTLYLLIDH